MLDVRRSGALAALAALLSAAAAAHAGPAGEAAASGMTKHLLGVTARLTWPAAQFGPGRPRLTITRAGKVGFRGPLTNADCYSCWPDTGDYVRTTPISVVDFDD